MSESIKIEVMEDIYGRNEQLAQEVNRTLRERGVFTINLMGAPGVGKTSLLTGLAQLLDKPLWVIEGDIESDIDTQALRAQGIAAHQINTGGACHLDAPQIEAAAATLAPKDGYLIIENIGNLVCPAEFMIGEDVKLLAVSCTEGSDKPYKYPLAFEKADLIVVNKCDLLPYVDFDKDYFLRGVRALQPDVPVLFLSAKEKSGLKECAIWIKQRASHSA